MRATSRRVAGFLLFLATAGSAHAAGGVDILACGTKEKAAITPTDPIHCEWKNGLFDATLAQLYMDGWRMVQVAFFDGTREVIYLERAEGGVAPASTKPTE
jgi:hypothetical protein